MVPREFIEVVLGLSLVLDCFWCKFKYFQDFKLFQSNNQDSLWENTKQRWKVQYWKIRSSCNCSIEPWGNRANPPLFNYFNWISNIDAFLRSQDEHYHIIGLEWRHWSREWRHTWNSIWIGFCSLRTPFAEFAKRQIAPYQPSGCLVGVVV